MSLERTLKLCALALVLVTMFAALAAPWLAPAPYEKQFRESPNAPPSRQFPLGTDELGRDRLSRLLYGTRVSLFLAPAAALLSTLLAAIVGIAAGLAAGSRVEKLILSGLDLMASLPWLFLLLAVRALLPLNVPATTSVTITFLLLGLLGWAGPARIVRAGVIAVRDSGFLLEARALGIGPLRLFAIQILPNLTAPIGAQFWLSIPAFLLAEANFGILGLGVSEPLPSWGNLLLDLVNHREILDAPWRLAPAVLLILVLLSLNALRDGLGPSSPRARHHNNHSHPLAEASAQ